jgi:acetyl-CoA synthetase
MYEGAPDAPDRGRMWKMVEDYRVTIFYTAPTAIRAFMKWGVDWPAKHDLSSLRLLGTVGEPINPEAWIWYHKNIGHERCPIVDTWWQTETGAIMIAPLPGVTEAVPGSATHAFPGIRADILTLEGRRIEVGGGFLAIRRPWPSMLRGIWGDEARFRETYWSKWAGKTVGEGDDAQPGESVYFPGDGAKRDERGNFWVIGRIDDVLNVAGHRIGTMEVESALVDHPAVAEAAVVGKAHELKGQAVAAFVTLKEGQDPTDALKKELSDHVVRKIGAIARPDAILFAADLPKTRSGKIMRRLLKDIAEGRALGDTTTLADPNVVASLKTDYESREG